MRTVKPEVLHYADEGQKYETLGTLDIPVWRGRKAGISAAGSMRNAGKRRGMKLGERWKPAMTAPCFSAPKRLYRRFAGKSSIWNSISAARHSYASTELSRRRQFGRKRGLVHRDRISARRFGCRDDACH